MAIKPNDPYESDAEIRRRGQQRFEEDMQADPELAEGMAGGGRIALFGIAILAILGVVFYGLNNPSLAPTSTAQTTTTAPSTPAPPPAGQTTGSATSTQTSPPPASTPNQSGDNANGNTTDTSSGSDASPRNTASRPLSVTARFTTSTRPARRCR